jgi:hypothetical protein
MEWIVNLRCAFLLWAAVVEKKSRPAVFLLAGFYDAAARTGYGSHGLGRE